MYRTQRWGLAFVNDDLTPFLGKRVPLVVFGFSNSELRETFDSYYSKEEIEDYARDISGSLEFQNLIHTRLQVAGLLELKIRLLVKQVEDMCTRLGAECQVD